MLFRSGVYAKRNLPAGYVVDREKMWEDFYLAIPLQKGQLSCREMMNGEQLVQDIVADAPLMVDALDSPYSRVSSLKDQIYSRGL